MSSESNAAATARGGAWSLTLRLSSSFALISLLLIAGIGIYLYVSLDQRLNDEHAMFLADDIELIRHTLAETDPAASFAGNPRARQALTPIGSRLRITVLNAQHEPILDTRALVPDGASGEAVAIGERADRATYWKAPDGRMFRVVAAQATLGKAAQPVTIVLALDVSLERRLLKGFRRTLWIAIAVGVLCAAALGYVMTRQGLLPLKRIARAAGAITSSQLDRKLDAGDSPAELRELVAAFNGMLDRLDDSFRRLSQFSSDLAHELRTPINNLMGEAQVALSRARPADEYRAVIESSIEELERLSRMTENMLFLARAEDAEQEIKRVEFDARGELEKIAEFYQLMADESRVRIVCRGEANVWADPLLFRRAVSNLLSNALRYTPGGREVSMSAHVDADGTAVIAVTNPGDGIAQLHIDRIFDRFYRADPARGKSSHGAGLGLAIVNSIMRLHGGAAGVVSMPGGLTEFSLRFPAATKTRPKSPTPLSSQ